MYKVKMSFIINVPDDGLENPSRNDLINKTKQIFDTLKEISLDIKVKKSIFKNNCHHIGEDDISEELINKKSQEFLNLQLKEKIIDGFIKSLEDRTGKIEIGRWICDWGLVKFVKGEFYGQKRRRVFWRRYYSRKYF